MTATTAIAPLCCQPTKRFSVLVQQNDAVNKVQVPLIHLSDLLLHSQKGTTASIRETLFKALQTQGFCFLLSPKDSRPAKIVEKLKYSIHNDLFDDKQVNGAGLETSEEVYVSEKGVPMYRLGYELAEDGMRELFRIAAGRPDDQPWPSPKTRSTWLQGLGLMRHITDTALDLIMTNADNDGQQQRRRRPGSGSSTWLQPTYSQTPLHSLAERCGDYSVLYAMHYFNERPLEGEDDDVVLKAHVDPSMLVLEPFLCQDTRGLEVWDRSNDTWLDCDGPNSPVASLWPDYNVQLLFVGKALAAEHHLEPTLHRVVTGDCPRCTVIYEQKYEEFYPPPSFD